MTKDEELMLFAQVGANNPNLKLWLEAERDSAIKYLAQGDKTFTLARAQGKFSFVDKMLELLNHKK